MSIRPKNDSEGHEKNANKNAKKGASPEHVKSKDGPLIILNSQGQLVRASSSEEKAFNERKKLFSQPFGRFQLASAEEISQPRVYTDDSRNFEP